VTVKCPVCALGWEGLRVGTTLLRFVACDRCTRIGAAWMPSIVAKLADIGASMNRRKKVQPPRRCACGAMIRDRHRSCVTCRRYPAVARLAAEVTAARYRHMPANGRRRA